MKFWKFLRRTPKRIKALEPDADIIRPHFDEAYYISRYPDAKNWPFGSLFHYLEHGRKEMRRPSRSFDPRAYSARYGSEIGAEDPFVHYIETGRLKGYLGSNYEDYVSDRSISPEGIVPSRRPSNDNDYALAIPLPEALRRFTTKRAAAIVHAFYPELIADVLVRLAQAPCRIDVFISTDRPEKRDTILELARTYECGTVDVRVVANRGRDLGPFIVAFPDVMERYEAVLHVHTKKSPHGGDALEPWRDYLYDNLIGSTDIIASNLRLLETDKIGFVYPQHFFVLRGLLNWGFDFDKASDMLRRAGFKLDRDMLLEFPSGSMFWARTSALERLLSLGLTFDDFDQEAGQVDGTLAHAMERSLLYFGELAGFTWTKVLRDDIAYPIPETILRAGTDIDLSRALDKIYRPVSTPAVSGRSPLQAMVPTIRKVLFKPSRETRPRIVLLIPSVNPRQAFGGIATALDILRKIAAHMNGAFDTALVATDAAVEPETRAAFPDYEFRLIDDIDQAGRHLVIDANFRETGYFQLRANDILIATAWWTADMARDAKRFQQQFFGVNRHFIYLIQDFEPNFYGWGAQYISAENTYRRSKDFIAIINSEELYRFFLSSEYAIEHAFCLPYTISSRIDNLLAPASREKIILVYARPSVHRNVFEILFEGISLWQSRNPRVASNWRIISAGADYPEHYVEPTQNVTNVGKLNLETYTYWLNRASVGVSLMISPHPSYPPLEMAEAGLMTITNSYAFKDLSARFDLISLSLLAADELADALEACVARYEDGTYPINQGRARPKAFDASGVELFTPEKLIQALGVGSPAAEAAMRGNSTETADLHRS